MHSVSVSNSQIGVAPKLPLGDIRREYIELNDEFKGYEGSLYDLFGGDPKMNLFVEDFMEGIMGDAELRCYH